jgi:uncharacterized protein (TIGR00369 family)
MAIQDLADSAFNDLIGFRIAEWREDYAVLKLELAARHLNRSKVVHGGVLATLIDAAAGFAGCYCSVPGNVRRALSLSVTTNFTGQAQAGVIRVVARKRAGGRTIYFASVEVFNDRDELIALGEATYRYRKGSENIEGVPAPAD